MKEVAETADLKTWHNDVKLLLSVHFLSCVNQLKQKSISKSLSTVPKIEFTLRY